MTSSQIDVFAFLSVCCCIRELDKNSSVLTLNVLDESQEFIFNGVSSRAVPPRMFCDICDQFDLHETEDCPTQVSCFENFICIYILNYRCIGSYPIASTIQYFPYPIADDTINIYCIADYTINIYCIADNTNTSTALNLDFRIFPNTSIKSI